LADKVDVVSNSWATANMTFSSAVINRIRQLSETEAASGIVFLFAAGETVDQHTGTLDIPHDG
jgi:hypothetical protein